MMRPVRLVRMAAEAEGHRLRGIMTRIIMKVVFVVVAFLFLIAAAVFAHAAAWHWIQSFEFSSSATAGILVGVDLLIALVMGGVASRSKPRRMEREALQVRRRAVAALRESLSLTQLALPALRLVPAIIKRPSHRSSGRASGVSGDRGDASAGTGRGG